MKRTAVVSLWVAAVGLSAASCGNKKPAANKDAKQSDGGSGSSAPIDAPVVDGQTPVAACTAVHGTTISYRQIGQVTGSAVLATSPPNDGRLFVIEQAGRIRVLDANDNLLPTPFLDISANNNGPVVAGGEQGLLGLAFDPAYATNHTFYVDYTADNPVSGGDPYVDVVFQYKTSASDPNVADPTSAKQILSIADYATNHNAGMIEFGSDGDLYITTGDGGAAGDPRRNAQNPSALLGKMLRLDVDHPAAGSAYGIPADNPFAAGGGAPEVYMLGLRNPWRWSFDRGNGDMWIGDVGQDVTEELDYLPAGHQLGTNLGWSAYEANACCATQGGACDQTGSQQACDTTAKFFPQVVRSHAGDGWNAIIGGQVYRGPCYPDLTGIYFFTDNGHHGLSEATVGSDGGVTATDLPGTWPSSPASLHADARGELYLTTTTGAVYHLEAGP
jgi:hypothetical protein|nr:PQQ-dependent sugar dehydrogenase [Kofleriaceae bacterium]